MQPYNYNIDQPKIDILGTIQGMQQIKANKQQSALSRMNLEAQQKQQAEDLQMKSALNEGYKVYGNDPERAVQYAMKKNPMLGYKLGDMLNKAKEQQFGLNKSKLEQQKSEQEILEKQIGGLTGFKSSFEKFNELPEMDKAPAWNELRGLIKDIGVDLPQEMDMDYSPQLGQRINALSQYSPTSTGLTFEQRKILKETGGESAFEKKWRFLKTAQPEKTDEQITAMAMGASSSSDIGSHIVVKDAMGNEITRIEKTISPDQQPWLKGAQATAKTTAEMEASGKVPLSDFDLATDKAFAPDYTAWITGGRADAKKGVDQLDIVSKALEKKGNNLTGPLVGLTPDILENLALPENVDAREAVSEVVQRNLRLVLGAQFTENEGKLLIARAYNPKLKPEINAKRVKRLLNQMKSALRAKEDAVRYVKTHGTLKGFEGNLVDSIDDFNLDEPQTGTPNKTSSRKTTNKDIDDMSESELDAFLKGKK